MSGLVVAVAFGLALACAPAARAGVYEVRSCGSSSASAFASANTSLQSTVSGAQCPQVGSQLLSGIYAGVASSSFTLAGAGAGWTIAAPPGLLLRQLDARRSIGRLSASWYVEASTPERVLERCDASDPAICKHGAAGGENTSYADLGARSVTFRFECRPPAPDDDLACVGRQSTQAWVAIYSATAQVDDPAPPALQPLSGTLVSPGWHGGTDSVDLSASDASGIKTLRLFAGDAKLFERQPACDYSRMQPCPASARETVSVDTSKLEDGTYQLTAVATDAADQPGTATAGLKVDRHAPGAPQGLAVQRNPDGTMAFAWTNPDQGTAAPIAGARYAVCDAAGASCAAGAPAGGTGIARLASVAIPAGEHIVKVWLQDEAGNADPASAATLTVDPTTIEAPSVLRTLPPVFAPGAGRPPSFKFTKASRAGATLTLSGTIAKGATAAIAAKAAKGNATATARTKPKQGRWTLRLALPASLRRANTFSVTVSYAGESAYARSTLRRRLTKQAAKRGSADAFSLSSAR